MLTITIKKTSGEVKTKSGIMVNGILTVDGRRPLFSGDLLKKYGLSLKVAGSMTVSTLTAEYKKCVFQEGTMEDGSIVTVKDPDAERKVEHNKQNDFLKKHGYNWKKESRYISGGEDLSGKYDGDFKNEWVLRGGGGKKFEGNISDLLTDLGYFGEQAKVEKAAREAKQAEEAAKREETKNAREVVIDYFSSFEGEKPETVEKFSEATLFHFTGFGFKNGTGTGYAVQKNVIWKIDNNGMDGDDWRLNNYKIGGTGAIAQRFPYNTKIADLIQNFALPGLYN